MLICQQLESCLGITLRRPLTAFLQGAIMVEADMHTEHTL